MKKNIETLEITLPAGVVRELRYIVELKQDMER